MDLEPLSWTSLAIDQSQNGTGLCFLKEGKPAVLETLKFTTADGWDRMVHIVERVTELLAAHKPTIVIMEDYAYGAQSSSVTRLAELGGCVKLAVHRHGYVGGREAILTGDQVFMTCPSGKMKKFMLGDGTVHKDEAYLLKVYQRLNRQFEDSNQADAYMHAWYSLMLLAVLRGKVNLDGLPLYQQEALISNGAKRVKGLSMAKALKLPAAGELELVGF